MTKAPSEKHLEDWIAANPEQVYWIDEENACAQWDGKLSVCSQVVSRQTRLPSGIADLIVYSETYTPFSAVSVIELKRDEIDGKALAQIMRYMLDLRSIFSKVRSRVLHDVVEAGGEYSDMGFPEISGVLIGHGVADKNTLVSCGEAGITVLDYKYVGDAYTFTELSLQYDPEHEKIYEDFSCGAIGVAFENAMKSRLAFSTRKQE